MKWILLLTLNFCFSAPCLANLKPIVLGIGHSHSFQFSKNKKVYISNGNAIRFKRLDASTVLVIGKSLGSSELHLGDARYRIEVTSKHAFSIYQKLNELLSDSLGLKVKLNLHCPSVVGKLLHWNDWIKIREHLISEKNPSHCKSVYQWQAKIDPVLQNNLPKLFSKNAFKEKLKIHFDGNDEIYFTNQSTGSSKEIKELVRSFGLELQPNYASGENNFISVEMLAISDSDMQNYGIVLPQKIEYGINTEEIQNDLIAKLSAASNEGRLENLVQAELEINENKEARFHSGGQIPIQIINETSSSVIWKNYGFLLEVKTKKQIAKKKLLNIEIELSNIDPSVAIDNVPSIQKHSFSNQVLIKENQKKNIFYFHLKSNQGSTSGLSFLKGLGIFNKLFTQSSERKQNYHIFINLHLKEKNE